MFEAYIEQKLVWRALGERFEQTAEMKGAYVAVSGYFLQGNVICIMFCDVMFCQFNSRKVLLFEACMNIGIGRIIGNAAQHFVHYFHHQVIDLQLAAGTGEDQAGNIIMQEFRFGCCFIQGRMEVIVGKELRFTVLL